MRKTIAAIAVIILFYLDAIISLVSGHLAFSPDVLLRLIPVTLIVCGIHLMGEDKAQPKAVAPEAFEPAVESAWRAELVPSAMPVAIVAGDQNVVLATQPIHVALENPVETADESELCEEPEPMRQFHAVDVEVASRRAAEKGLFLLFQERDRYDLYGRKRVYWAITPYFGEKLLKCVSDMKPASEFSAEEKEVLRSMVTKRWIKLMKEGKESYYYGLDERTAANVERQLARY